VVREEGGVQDFGDRLWSKRGVGSGGGLGRVEGGVGGLEGVSTGGGVLT